MAEITPDDVNRLTKPTDGFLCSLSANHYNIEFLSFVISDYDTKNTIFEVGRDSPVSNDVSIDFSSVGEDMYRKIKYNFSEDVLRLPYIQTSLTFSVGDQELPDFRMIERHYFRDRLVKSFDFEFGFCIPGSVNTWDAVYSLPLLSDDLINEMIENPFQTKSDSFYFVDNVLVMHNKASYKYFKEDAAQEKKSYEDKYGSKGDKAAKATAKTAGAKAAKTEIYMETDEEPEAEEKEEYTPRSAAAKKAAKEPEWSKDEDYM